MHPLRSNSDTRARSIDDYNSLIERLGAFPSVPVSDTDHRRALELQEALAHRGHHRALSLVDALVASVGEARGLEILHYDADFELLAGVTGQGQRWIVERGTAD